MKPEDGSGAEIQAPDKLKKEKKRKKNEIDMCSGPILGKMLAFSFPLMFSGILQLLFNAADIIVVGRWAGDNSLAAVGSTTALVNLLTNLFIGISIGGNVLAAKYFGSRKHELLSRTLHTSIALSILSGALLAFVGFFVARPVLALMQTPDNVIGLAALYMKILFLGMPAMMIYNFGSAMLRAKGDTKRPLYYLLTAGIVNVVLNVFFVIELHMDVAGVATATAISQYLSALLILRCLMKEEGDFKLSLKKLKVHRQQFKDLLRIGLPAGFQGMLFSLSNVIIQSSINSFGDVTMAGSAAASNIEGFVYTAMNAFYQAAISFVSQNVGAGNYGRVKPIMVRALSCAAITGILLGNLSYIFGNQLLSIYTTSPAVIAEGMIRLAAICAPYAICGMMDSMVGVLRGLGYSILPMIVSLVGACLLRLVWIAAVFSFVAEPVPVMIYISYPVTWSVTLVAHIICYLLIMKKVIKPMMERAADFGSYAREGKKSV